MLRPLLASILTVSLCSIAASQVRERTVAHYGSSCGPTLKMEVEPSGSTHHVFLNVKGAKSDSRLIMLIAADRTDLPLRLFFLNTKQDCRLLLVPIFIQQHNPDASGNFSFDRSIGSLWRGTAHAQFLELQATGTVLATNGATLISK